MEIVRLDLKAMDERVQPQHLVHHFNVQTVAFAIQMPYAFNIQIHRPPAYAKQDILEMVLARMDVLNLQAILAVHCFVITVVLAFEMELRHIVSVHPAIVRHCVITEDPIHVD